VQSIHAEIVEVIKENQDKYTEDPDLFISKIGKALEPLVDFNRISRNVMGKHYKSASVDQRNQFTVTFKKSLLDTYAKTLAEFKDEKINVLPAKEKSKKQGREKVYIEIITETKKYPGVYSMYLDNNGNWKIINIVINGVNLGLTFRNQFYSLMEGKLANYDSVITAWETSL